MLLRHLNILKTLYFNFRVFKFREAVKLPVFLYDSIQLECLHKGCVKLKESKTGMVKIGGGDCTAMFGNSVLYKSYIRIEGELILSNNVTIAQGCIISICKGATVKIKNNVYINRNFKLHSKSQIIIEDNCRIGWDVQIIDTNFHYTVNNGKLYYRNGDIYIGHNTWITNSVSIMKGTYLPPYSVIASKSIVNKNLKEYGEKKYVWRLSGKINST